MKDFTTATAAKSLDVSPGTVRRWVDLGLVQARVTVGGHRRISAAEVERLKEQMCASKLQTAPR